MCLLLLLLLVVLAAAAAAGGGGAKTSFIGINYGQFGDNLPPPHAVLPLLRSLSINHVKLYDADPKVLLAFANTNVRFTVGLPNNCLPAIARNPSLATDWLNTNIHPFIAPPNIDSITVGNEVLTSSNETLIHSLLPAMHAVHSALQSHNHTVSVTTAHSLAVLSSSDPPSGATFRKDLLPHIFPLLTFLSETGSPFLINAYPYLEYKADPKRVPLNYVLFEENDRVVDGGSGLRYGNMLHAQVDAVRAAMAAVGMAGVEVVVSETGWPSAGDGDEAGATPENARRYNGNLMRMVAEGRGTPMKPGVGLGVYVSALFDENLKPGPASERHYGLFNLDGSPTYQVGVAGNVTAAGGGGSGGGGEEGGDADRSQVHRRQAARHQGRSRVGSDHRRREQAPPLPPRDHGSARDPEVPEEHRAVDQEAALPTPDSAGLQDRPPLPEPRRSRPPGGRRGQGRPFS